MRLYALVEAGDPEAIDVYLCEQDAQRALEAVHGMSRTGKGCSASRRSNSTARCNPPIEDRRGWTDAGADASATRAAVDGCERLEHAALTAQSGIPPRV